MSNRVRRGLARWLLPVVLAVSPAVLPAQQAENGSVAGKVTTEGSDQPVAAAHVGIASLNVTAVTGADGSYILPGVKPGTYVLQVMRIGFRARNLSVEVMAGATTRTDIKINEAALALDAIVVTGTVGQASVRSVGNSISQLNVGRDVKQPVQTLETLLQGRSAGIVIPTGRADMGSGQAIRLRGNASLSLTSYPLIYIDGIRQTGEGYSGVRQGGQSSMLNDIDPSTIDRVEIVKGPAATALYGTEAAAGVIQIFTKRGIPGRTVWTFQTDQGQRRVAKWGSRPGTYVGTPGIPVGTVGRLLGSPAVPAGTPTEACIVLADAAAIAGGAAYAGSAPVATGLATSGCHRPYHDMDPYITAPYRQRYTVSVAGGSDVVRFFTSGSGEGGKGILPSDDDLRYQFRSNVSFRPSSKLNVDVSTAYSQYQYHYTGSNNGVESLYFQVVRRPLNGPSTYSYAVMDSILQQDNLVKQNRMILGITGTWTPLKGMIQKLTVGYDDARQDEKYLYPLNFLVTRTGRIGLDATGSQTLSTDYIISQQLAFWGLKLTPSVGGQVVQRNERRTNLEGTGLPSPGYQHTVQSASTLVSQIVTEQRVVTGGFLFQNLFAFKDRYFVTVGSRVDGNSAFGKDLGLQTYPKASASYVVSEEPFFPDFLGTWKLRAAYGWAGRAPGAFDATQTWTPLLFTGGGGTAFVPSNPGNSSLGPERSREFEVGFDASVFQDRLTADVSWYNRVTHNALLNVSRPASLGNTNAQLENVGEFLNRGLEVGATGIILSGQNLGFEIQATMATNFSEVTTVGTATINNVQVGHPAPVVRATKVAGSLGGDMNSFEDPVQLPDSMNFWGPNLPTHTFTLAPTFRGPKGITLTLRGEYQKGHWVGQGAAHFLAQRGPYGPSVCDVVYRIVPWNEYDGPRTMYGNVAAINTHVNLGKVSAVDRARCYRTVIQGNSFTWPADFFKVREITIQTPLPFRIPRVQSAVLTLSARNLFTRMSKLNRSQDPDAGNSVEGLTFGYTDAVPAPAEFTVSFRATF